MTTAEHSDHCSTTMSSAEATLCAQLPRDAQKTLYSILSRVALPSEADEKYRTLKLDNAALQQRLLRHDGALELLALCRFELRGRTLVLPADASADAIHRALDAITAAAAPAASVPPAVATSRASGDRVDIAAAAPPGGRNGWREPRGNTSAGRKTPPRRRGGRRRASARAAPLGCGFCRAARPPSSSRRDHAKSRRAAATTDKRPAPLPRSAACGRRRPWRRPERVAVTVAM